MSKSATGNSSISSLLRAYLFPYFDVHSAIRKVLWMLHGWMKKNLSKVNFNDKGKFNLIESDGKHFIHSVGTPMASYGKTGHTLGALWAQ